MPGRWPHGALSALLWRAPPPKGEARLGSPFGRAGAVRRLRGRGATVREKRFAVSLVFSHALRAYKVKGKVAPFLKKKASTSCGRTTKNFTLATARPPPRTCAILLMSTSGSELPLARIESPGTGPRTCAILSMSTSGSELPKARIARGATPAHVRYPLAEHERQRASRLPARSVLNGPHWGPGPQGANCLGCNPRELTAQALGKLYVGSPFSCSVNLRGQPTGCPRFFYAAPSSRAPG